MARPELDAKSVSVMIGFSKLDYSERKALMEWINEYQRDINNREVLLSEVRKSAGGLQMMTGPASGGCLCCGR